MRTGLWIFSVVAIAAVAVGIPYAMLLKAAGSGTTSVAPIILSSAIALCTTFLAVGIGTVGALAAAQFSRTAVLLLDVILLFQLTIPHFVIGAGWKTIMGRTGIHLCSQCNFSGLGPLLFTFTVAFTPLAYFVQRTALRSVPPDEVDAARVAGLHGWALFRAVYQPRLVLFAPALAVFIFSAALSDPVTPNVMAPRASLAATRVWFQGDQAGTALALTLPVAGAVVVAGLVYARLLRSNPALVELLHFAGDSSGQPHRAVGTQVRAPQAVLCLLGAVAGLFVLVAAYRGFVHGSETPMGNAVVNTVGLAFLMLLCSLLLSAVALGARRSCGLRWGWMGRRSIDAVFALLALSPGAAIGCGLQIASNHPGVHRPWASLSLVLLACLPSSLAMTYFLMVYIGPLMSRSEYMVSLLQGVGPLRAVASIVLPRSTNVVILGFLMVFSNASVLAVPLLWVSSPDTPLLMLRLFTLLDAANYPAALYISMTVSLFIVSLAGAIVVSINGVGLAAFARKQVAPWR